MTVFKTANVKKYIMDKSKGLGLITTIPYFDLFYTHEQCLKIFDTSYETQPVYALIGQAM